MIWKTCSVRVASRPATAMTTIAVSQPTIQAAALRGDAVAAGMAAILAQRAASARRRIAAVGRKAQRAGNDDDARRRHCARFGRLP